MKFKIKIMIIVSFVVIVSMSFFIVHSNPISLSVIQPDNVITGSNNSYLITLKGVPSGNGTYQQLLTINNYSKYGINDNGSNIEFFDYSNYTHLYAWIQSINSSTLTIWIKNYNDSSFIDIQVLSKVENLFSVKGYLGEAPQLSSVYAEYSGNAYKIFSQFDDFTNISGWTTSNTSLDYANNGLYMLSGPSLISDNTYNFEGHSFVFYGEFINQSSANIPTDTTYIYASIGSDYYNRFMFGNGNYGWGYYIYNNTNGHQFTYRNFDSLDSLYSITPYYSNSSAQFSVNGVSTTVSYNSVVYQNQSLDFNNFNCYNVRIGPIYYEFITQIPLSSMPTFTVGSSIYHSIDFKLLGSPFSSLWNIMVNGTTYQADSSNIYLNMTNGYYNIIVNLPAGYSAITKGVLYVNGTNQVYKIFVSYNNNSGISNDIIYAIILASIIVAAAIYFSKRS